MPIVSACIAIGLQYADPFSVEALRFDRAAIKAGEWWRLLSGNFCHLSWTHLWANLLGLLLVSLLFLRSLTFFWWLGLMLLGAMWVGVALYFITPDVHRYVGLSGILHGVIVVGAVVDFRRQRMANLILLAGLSGKIAWEQSSYYRDDMSHLIGGNVLVDSHLLGAMVGAVVLLMGVVVGRAWFRMIGANERN